MKVDRIDDPKVILRHIERIIKRQETTAEKATDTRLFLKLCLRYFERSERRYEELGKVTFGLGAEKRHDEPTGKTLRRSSG